MMWILHDARWTAHIVALVLFNQIITRSLLQSLPLGHANSPSTTTCGLGMLPLHTQAPVVAQTAMLPAITETFQFRA